MNVGGCFSVVASAFAAAVLAFFAMFGICRLIAWATGDVDYMYYMWYSMLIVPGAGFLAAIWRAIQVDETRKPSVEKRGFEVIQNSHEDADPR